MAVQVTGGRESLRIAAGQGAHVGTRRNRTLLCAVSGDNGAVISRVCGEVRAMAVVLASINGALQSTNARLGHHIRVLQSMLRRPVSIREQWALTRPGLE